MTDGSHLPLSPSDGESDTEDQDQAHPSHPSQHSTNTTTLHISGYKSYTVSTTPSSEGSEGSGSGLYTIALHSISRPHVIITSTSTGKDVGSITFHPFSRSISLVVNGLESEIKHKGVFKSGYIYASPTLHQQLEWKGGATSTLIDEKGNAVARFESHRLQGWRGKTVEIVSRVGGEEENEVKAKAEEDWVLEVLTSAVAVMELRRRRSRNSAGGAGGAPGGG